MLTAGCGPLLPFPSSSPLLALHLPPVLRSIGVDGDTVASGRAPAAPGLGRERIADAAKDGKETTAAKWMARPFYTPMK